MNYYDNIKDSVKNEASGGGSGANFDSLKEAAQESSEEEKQGDDTEIEVLEEGLNPQPAGKTQKQKKRQQRQEQDNSPARDSSSHESGTVERKLDRLVEQNERIIQILEQMV